MQILETEMEEKEIKEKKMKERLVEHTKRITANSVIVSFL